MKRVIVLFLILSLAFIVGCGGYQTRDATTIEWGCGFFGRIKLPPVEPVDYGYEDNLTFDNTTK